MSLICSIVFGMLGPTFTVQIEETVFAYGSFSSIFYDVLGKYDSTLLGSILGMCSLACSLGRIANTAFSFENDVT